MELLTHVNEHHEIGDGGWLMMTMATNSLLWSPRTDSRSALPRGLSAWRRLRIVKRDESFSLIFFLPEHEYMELELRSMERQGARPGGQARPPPSWTGCGPPGLDSFTSIFYIFQNLSPWIFRSFRELLFSTHKTTSWPFC